MSLGACLGPLEAGGKIPADQAAEARSLYEERLAAHLRSGSRETAEALASAEVLEALDRQVTRKEFLAGRTIKVRGRIEQDLASFGGGSGDGEGGGRGGAGGPIDPRSGPALIDHDARAPYANVEGRRKAVLGEALRQLDRLMAEHSQNLVGKVRNKAQLLDVVRELFGENSGNEAAKAIAEAWRRTAEGLRQRFNAAGGEIGFRADWGLPQSHDWRSVRQAGFEAWKQFLLPERGEPLLDIGKMTDTHTGLPMTREALDEILPEVWDTIRTNGWSKRTPGSPGKGMMANRRADPRFLVFKDAESWLAYQAKFGKATAYDAMMGHVEQMARDIAAMEILGPNPDATLKWLKDTLEQSAARDLSPDSDGASKARGAGKKIDELWSEYTGANNEPRNEKLALVFSGWRAFATSTKLGSAFLSSTSDQAFAQARAAFNGLGKASMMGRYLELMKPGSIEDQKMAVRRGLIAEEWAKRTAAQSRYLMEELTGRVPKLLAEGILRVSLLARHTQALRWAYGLETLATYTEHAGQAFEALPAPLRTTLDRYGMDAKDWEALRTAPMDLDRGAEWLAPHRLEDQDLAARFMAMIHEETDLAVPVADLATRAMFNKAERGTLIGEAIRSGLLFKSFGVSVLLKQSHEILAMQPATAARYAGALIIGTTLMGALAMQLKNLAAGKDPQHMADPAFWGAAIAQGGGFGIFGDFLYSADARTGNGLAETIAGPMVDDVQSIANVVTAKHPRRQLVREAKGFVPGNNLWYARLAFDRLLADQIEQAVNPDYHDSWRRMARYAREQGTGFWWAPGEMSPSRAPDFSNATEGGSPP